jgi:hypothetical protein
MVYLLAWNLTMPIESNHLSDELLQSIEKCESGIADIEPLNNIVK